MQQGVGVNLGKLCQQKQDEHLGGKDRGASRICTLLERRTEVPIENAAVGVERYQVVMGA